MGNVYHLYVDKITLFFSIMNTVKLIFESIVFKAIKMPLL